MTVWTYGDGDPKRVTAACRVRAIDFAEIAQQVNRRRRLVYLAEDGDLADPYVAHAWVHASAVTALWAPFTSDPPMLVVPVAGGLGGDPPTPASMRWLWPEADADEDKPISLDDPPPAGEVNFFAKMNGSDPANWTEPVVLHQPIRTVHLNELRWAIEHLVRGRWRWPIYPVDGLLSLLPDMPWISDCIANNGTDELRSLGPVLIRSADALPLGLSDVTVRSARLELTTDVDCTVEVYRCLRPIDWDPADLPTWNQYDPSANLAWQTPGGLGAADAQYIGQVALTADVPGTISNATLTAAVQAMIDGAPQNWLFRRADPSPHIVGFAVNLEADFDVND